MILFTHKKGHITSHGILMYIEIVNVCTRSSLVNLCFKQLHLFLCHITIPHHHHTPTTSQHHHSTITPPLHYTTPTTSLHHTTSHTSHHTHNMPQSLLLGWVVRMNITMASCSSRNSLLFYF